MASGGRNDGSQAEYAFHGLKADALSKTFLGGEGRYTKLPVLTPDVLNALQGGLVRLTCGGITNEQPDGIVPARFAQSKQLNTCRPSSLFLKLTSGDSASNHSR